MNTKILPLFLIVALGLLLFTSCNHSFSPKGPFEQELVAYSILSDESDMQFVRVYASYDVQGYDPFENRTDTHISGALVTMTGPSGICTFRDTLLPRSDTSQYKSPIVAYVSSFQVQRGETYKLAVNAGGAGSTGGTVTIPNKLRNLWMVSGFDLDDVGEIKKYLQVTVVAWGTPLTKGYAGQMLLQFSVLTETGWQDKQWEVPGDEPGFSVTNRVIERSSDQSGFSFARSNVTYKNTLDLIWQINKDTRITFKRAVFRVLQVEKNMYDYYKIVHGFQDPYTIRFDQPDFTNLSQGFGLFGGCTIDTLVHDYPANFGWNR